MFLSDLLQHDILYSQGQNTPLVSSMDQGTESEDLLDDLSLHCSSQWVRSSITLMLHPLAPHSH